MDPNVFQPSSLSSSPLTISGTGEQQQHLDILTPEGRFNGTGNENLLPLNLHFFFSVPTLILILYTSQHCKKISDVVLSFQSRFTASFK